MIRRFPHWLLAVACIVFLQTSVQARAQQLSADAPERLVTFFYQDPRPERLIGFIEKFDSLPVSQRWQSYPPTAAFLAVVFRAHPDQIERLLPAKVNARSAAMVVAALQLSGNRSLIAKFQSKLTVPERDSNLEAALSGLPSRLEDLWILDPMHLDMLWGAAFASGDERFARMILDFFAQTANRSDAVALDIVRTVAMRQGGPRVDFAKYDEATAKQIVFAGSALWSLLSNARQHAFVEKALETYVQNNQGTPAAKALAARKKP